MEDETEIMLQRDTFQGVKVIFILLASHNLWQSNKLHHDVTKSDCLSPGFSNITNPPLIYNKVNVLKDKTIPYVEG